MDEILNILVLRLINKGILPSAIAPIVGDVVRIISDGGEFTVDMINRQLKNRGWADQVMDEYAFELVLYILKNTGTYDVVDYTLH